MSAFARLRPTLAVALAVIALDQGSKIALSRWLPEGERLVLAPFLQLVSVYNTGAAFSFLAQAGGWQRGLFLALAFGVSAWLSWLAASPGAERMERFEAQLIREALQAHQGDIKATLESLGIPRKTFYDKLQRHGIDRQQYTQQ